MLVDEDFLRSIGLTDKDLVRYRCVPDFDPPRILAPEEDEDEKSAQPQRSTGSFMKRGSVRQLEKDKLKSSL